MQEQKHYEVFEKMAGAVSGAASPPAPDAERESTRSICRLRWIMLSLPGQTRHWPWPRQARDRQSALRAAIGFEKDTLLFFYDLREMVSEAEQKAITGIIREEKVHLRRLARAL